MGLLNVFYKRSYSIIQSVRLSLCPYVLCKLHTVWGKWISLFKIAGYNIWWVLSLPIRLSMQCIIHLLRWFVGLPVILKRYIFIQMCRDYIFLRLKLFNLCKCILRLFLNSFVSIWRICPDIFCWWSNGGEWYSNSNYSRRQELQHS